MLTITLQSDEENNAQVIELEHSLVSLSKWEQKHEKAFFGRDGMTSEETLSYIELMLLTPISDPNWVERLSVEDFSAITNYINSKQTATWFRGDDKKSPSREVITNELIYYWMISFNIPFEPCQNWHVNRLMTLIKICGLKQTKPKKMSKQAQAEEYRRLNAIRREQLGTSG